MPSAVSDLTAGALCIDPAAPLLMRACLLLCPYLNIVVCWGCSSMQPHVQVYKCVALSSVEHLVMNAFFSHKSVDIKHLKKDFVFNGRNIYLFSLLIFISEHNSHWCI